MGKEVGRTDSTKKSTAIEDLRWLMHPILNLQLLKAFVNL